VRARHRFEELPGERVHVDRRGGHRIGRRHAVVALGLPRFTRSSNQKGHSHGLGRTVDDGVIAHDAGVFRPGAAIAPIQAVLGGVIVEAAA